MAQRWYFCHKKTVPDVATLEMLQLSDFGAILNETVRLSGICRNVAGQNQLAPKETKNRSAKQFKGVTCGGKLL